jgi:NAD(P)H dehydrogenase (quinone)
MHIKIIFILAFFISISYADTTHVLIVYFSKTGNTEKMALEVKKGAESVDSVNVVLRSVENAKTDEILKADAIILGSPVYNANVAPEMQYFINNWPFRGEPLKNKIGASFVTAGGISAGEELVQLNILHSMLIFGMIVVGGNSWQSAFGASAVTKEEPFAKNEEIDDHFLTKGFDLGKRVAELARNFKPGK